VSRQKLKRTNLDKWAELLEQELSTDEVLPKGEGWLTFTQIKLKLNICNHRIYHYIRKLKARNKVEQFSGKILIENKLVKRLWYRIKD
jgi:hypothetical protein